jgi:hypothetical protein
MVRPKSKLRSLLLCAALQFGVLAGVPMRPEQIEELMRQLSAPKLAQVLPTDEESGDGPPSP